MKAKRRPAPKRIASSTSAAVATSSRTSQSASRQSASRSRSATKPSISFRTRRTCIPTARYAASARSSASADVRSPPQTSTSGSRYTGLNGCPTRSRSGRARAACSSVGRRPDVDEQRTASGGAAPSAAASSSCLSATSSGADSWTSSTPRTASATEAHAVSVPSGGSGASVSRSYARRAFSRTPATARTASRFGSYRRTSTPFSRNRAAQPPPMTPPPSSATALGRSGTHAEGELLPHLLRPQHAHVHRLEDRDGPLDELAVRGEAAACEVEVVFEADAHVAADEHRQGDERELHAADRERREDGVRRQAVDHREQRRQIVGGAVRDPRAELDERRVVDQPVADQLVHEHEMAGVEHLELRPDAELLHARGHRAQHPRRVHHHVVAAGGEVHRAAVERADLGQQLLDVGDPLQRA